MMVTVPHVTSGSGLRKFQADGFLFDRVYKTYGILYFPITLATERRQETMIRSVLNFMKFKLEKCFKINLLSYT